MITRSRLVCLCVCLASLAAAPPPKDATPPLKITEDDRDILLGFQAERALVLAPIEARQAAYLQRLGRRLGVDPRDLERKYRFDLQALTVVLATEPSAAQP
jgi:hypothetical protein